MNNRVVEQIELQANEGGYAKWLRPFPTRTVERRAGRWTMSGRPIAASPVILHPAQWKHNCGVKKSTQFLPSADLRINVVCAAQTILTTAMRLSTLISAVLLALCCTVSRAAIFHLEDVILGTIPDQSHQYSDPLTIVSRFFVLDSPFSSRSFVGDYRITFKDLKGKIFTSVTPVAPFYWQHQSVMVNTSSTRVTLHNPSFGMSFLLPIGAGIDIDRGTVPLLSYGSQHELGWWDNSVGLMDGYGYPVLHGSLTVNDSTYGSDDTLPVFASVPELDTWTIWLAGCVALGRIATRRMA